jgi:ribosomal protein S21
VTGSPTRLHLLVDVHGDVARAIKAFTSRYKKHGLAREITRKTAYTKPGQARRVKALRARRRDRRVALRMERAEAARSRGWEP